MATTNNVGRISQVIGAVVDVTFPDALPAILSAPVSYTHLTLPTICSV